VADLSVVAKVSRTLQGSPDLNINDHANYVIAGPSIFQGQVNWQRQQSGAPWVDGEVTWERHRSNSTEPLTIYVKGSSMLDLETKIGDLHAAFFQDRYTLQITVNDVQHSWDCECADVTSVQYDTVHAHAMYVAVTYSIPRKPVPLAGTF
jgi:hypothetical protein